jgi:peptidoglycan hydrolase-like protein with peptidoglycan-binding domain
MRLRTATHLALTLLVAAGLGVSSGSARAQAAAKKKSSATKPGTSPSHHGKSSKSTKKSSRRGKMQKAPTSERVTEIQQALVKNGALAGTPNGKWDSSTTEAMKSFQAKHGLNPTGKLDAKTLQQLGLGAPTSGVAPPTPLVNTSSRLTSVPGQTARRQ